MSAPTGLACSPRRPSSSRDSRAHTTVRASHGHASPHNGRTLLCVASRNTQPQKKKKTINTTQHANHFRCGHRILFHRALVHYFLRHIRAAIDFCWGWWIVAGLLSSWFDRNQTPRCVVVRLLMRSKCFASIRSSVLRARLMNYSACSLYNCSSGKKKSRIETTCSTTTLLNTLHVELYYYILWCVYTRGCTRNDVMSARAEQVRCFFVFVFVSRT